MSKTMVMSPIMSALLKSEDFLGRDREWHAINEIQARFLREFFARRHELVKFSREELRSWASCEAAELNKVLQKEGFDIRLNEFEPGDFGIVSILDVLAEWLESGKKSQVIFGGKRYPAVEMKNGFKASMSLKYHMPVAVLSTKSGDQVFMTIADRACEGFDLISRIEEISNSFMEDGDRYDFLTFPMVTLDQRVDISWLESIWALNLSGDIYDVSRALQQTKLKMNESGIRVKSAVALTLRFTASIVPTRRLIIDKPFFLWIKRPGMSVPVMYAYIDQADWKDPENLEM